MQAKKMFQYFKNKKCLVVLHRPTPTETFFSARPKSFFYIICPLKTLKLSMKSQTNKIKCCFHEKTTHVW